VLLSSHLMSEMAMTADRLIVIGRGRLIAQATVADFLASSSGSYVRVRSPQAGALAALLTARGAALVDQAGDALRITGLTSEAVGELAREGGFSLAELSVHQATLEDRYMELARDTADYRTADGMASARK
jgi:ABC-2 type transport system ATP-binding protein